MTKPTARLAAGLSAGALALTACGGGKGADDIKNTGTNGPQVKSITLMAAQYSDGTEKFWKDFAATYKSKYGIDLNVQVVNWNDINQQSKTAIQNGNPPDILNIDVYSTYAKDNLLYNADEVLPSSVQADLFDAFKTAGTYNGKVYGFPDLSSARALFYNKTLFAEAGIATPPKTWAEFTDAAKKITALGGGKIGYAMPLGPEEAQGEFSIWAFNNGGNWKDADGKWTINSAKNIETLEFMKNLSNVEKVTQNNPGKTNRTDGAFPLFTSGKAGMVVGFSPLAGTLDKDGKVDYGVAPMPVNDGGASRTYGVTDYLNAFKKPGNQDALKKFYELYYQQDQINTFIKTEGFLPVTKSGVEFFSTDPKLKVYLDTLPNIILVPGQDPVWNTVKLAVQQNLGAAVGPNGDPAKVLGDLQKQAEGAS